MPQKRMRRLIRFEMALLAAWAVESDTDLPGGRCEYMWCMR